MRRDASRSWAAAVHSGPMMEASLSAGPLCPLVLWWRQSLPPSSWQVRHHLGSRRRITSAAGLSEGALARYPSSRYAPTCRLSPKGMGSLAFEPRRSGGGRPHSCHGLPPETKHRGPWCEASEPQRQNMSSRAPWTACPPPPHTRMKHPQWGKVLHMYVEGCPAATEPHSVPERHTSSVFVLGGTTPFPPKRQGAYLRDGSATTRSGPRTPPIRQSPRKQTSDAPPPDLNRTPVARVWPETGSPGTHSVGHPAQRYLVGGAGFTPCQRYSGAACAVPLGRRTSADHG